ncbi:hypothetical protein RRSWK_03107 [Rhodopirellula sp. SWK7]|nr:hypothetical protein RRSWK_03107 [Rhodopirellula sp. SWK7]
MKLGDVVLRSEKDRSNSAYHIELDAVCVRRDPSAGGCLGCEPFADSQPFGVSRERSCYWLRMQ